MRGNRLQFIDAARGAAMLLVFVAHFSAGYFDWNDVGFPRQVATLIGMAASPTFMVLSGLVLGYLYATNRDDFRPIRAKLIDRGLVLLVVGHIVITIAHIPFTGGLANAWRWGFITDAIGFNLIVGSLVIQRLGPEARLAVATAVYVGASAGALVWQPVSWEAVALKETFLGPDPAGIYTYNFPMLPWFAVYLASSVFGERIAAARSDVRSVTGVAARHGARGMALGALAAIVLVALTAHASGPGITFLLGSPLQKRPPSVPHLLFYAGSGLVMLHVVAELEARPALARVVGALARLGRASLAAFVVQYFVFYSFFPVTGLPYAPWWPAYLAISAAGIWVVAAAWDRFGANRFLTVGYARLHPVLETWWSARRPRVPSPAWLAAPVVLVVLGLVTARERCCPVVPLDYSHHPIIFVHGYGETGEGTWRPLMNYLAARGYPGDYLLAVDIVPNTSGNVRAAARFLDPAAASLLARAQAAARGAGYSGPVPTRVDIVAHSMGALSSRWYADRMHPERVGTWISLAGANHGTQVSCSWVDQGARDMCPAFVNTDQARAVQPALNGTPAHPRDPTPWGIGPDLPEVPRVPPSPERTILYFTVGLDHDDVLQPDSTATLEGTGGCAIQVPPGVPAAEITPGNFRITGSAHDRLPRDLRVFPLVEAMLALDIEFGTAGPRCAVHHAPTSPRSSAVGAKPTESSGADS